MGYDADLVLLREIDEESEPVEDPVAEPLDVAPVTEAEAVGVIDAVIVLEADFVAPLAVGVAMVAESEAIALNVVDLEKVGVNVVDIDVVVDLVMPLFDGVAPECVELRPLLLALAESVSVSL